jgi:guanylate kinase
LNEGVRGNLFVISAPSGAGKTSLVKSLMGSLADLAFSVSHTTRPPRSGERDGVDYHFVDEVRFDALQSEGRFLEHAEVFGHRYGTTREAVDTLRDQGKDVILEIDWQGARQIRATVPESLSLFILPPSRRELERRLRARAQDDETVIARRLADAVSEMSHYGEFDHLIINDHFDAALDQIRAVILAARTRRPRQQARYAALLRDLLA